MKTKFKRQLLLGWAFLLLVTTLAFYIWLNFTFISVHGDSMSPTFADGDLVFLKNQSDYERSQIVVFRTPDAWTYLNNEEEGKLLIKRIAAAPGDLLEFNGQKFSVNGETVWIVPADYDCRSPNYSQRLASDQLFVMGDNARSSLDSRLIFCRGGVSYFVDAATVRTNGSILKTS